MKFVCKVLISFLVTASVGALAQETPPQHGAATWQAIFQNDAQGKALHGDVADLIAAVRHGVPIRLAWASKRPNEPLSVEHVADAQFLTIMNGHIVQAQIQRIYGQNPDFANKIMKFRDQPLNYWSAIFSSNGKGVMLNYDIEHGKLVSHNERGVSITWYALIPPGGLAKVKPLWQPRSP